MRVVNIEENTNLSSTAPIIVSLGVYIASPLFSHSCPRYDTQLWKSARTQLHHLLISGLLMEMQSKREFARAFTRCYGQLMKEFVQDDHEHSFSITSLSVQLFTMTTLAHFLIRHEDVLAILLRSGAKRRLWQKGL